MHSRRLLGRFVRPLNLVVRQPMRRSRTVLLTLAGIWVSYGIALPHIAHKPDDVAAAQVFLGFLTAPFLFTWCKLDTRERAVEAPAPAAALVGGMALIGVPYYFFRTMRPARAVLSTLKAAAYYLGISAGQWCAFYVSSRSVV